MRRVLGALIAKERMTGQDIQQAATRLQACICKPGELCEASIIGELCGRQPSVQQATGSYFSVPRAGRPASSTRGAHVQAAPTASFSARGVVVARSTN